MRLISLIFLIFCTSQLASAQSLWNKSNDKKTSIGEVKIVPNNFSTWVLNDKIIQSLIKLAPKEIIGENMSEHPNKYPIWQIPNPDGTIDLYYISKHQIMHPGLAAKYPGIETFIAINVNNPAITGRLDFTPLGFHAMIMNGDESYFIDPLTNKNSGLYQVYYKNDFSKPLQDRMLCQSHEEATEEPITSNKTNGTIHRKYRLALACTGDYAIAVAGANPTKSAVLAKMVTSVNRVSGIYEKELAVTLELIESTDTLIFLDPVTDVFTNNSGSTMLNQNQTLVNLRIGTANYDIGHVFSTGGGGIASLGCLCTSNKAKGVTGSPNPQGDPFDVDYVAHEIGHQFGGNHTYEAETGSCGGNRSTSAAYEIGSGTTIMAYAGICGTNDIQNNSDAYFSIRSLDQIGTLITGGANACAAKTNLTNTPPTFASIATINRSIPFKTYFEMDRKATDAQNNPITYCWEQYDLTGLSTGTNWNSIKTKGPQFRSFTPIADSLRTFPKKSSIVLKSYGYLGELLPGVMNELNSTTTFRDMNFKLVVRDLNGVYGSYTYSDENTLVKALRGSDSFRVTSQNTSGLVYNGDDNLTVTWREAGTSTNPAINAPNVDIFVSIDGGLTWPYKQASNVPNNGTAVIVLPNATSTTKARVKVKGAGNIFFDINKINFSINKKNYATSIGNAILDKITIYPNPASEFIQLEELDFQGNVALMDVLGNIVSKYLITEKSLQIPVQNFSNGVYYLLIQNNNGSKTTRKIVITK
jgi:Metallo-peptidase family M12B Reprolysin-like/Secretion system C-terminal sorting domain